MTQPFVNSAFHLENKCRYMVPFFSDSRSLSLRKPAEKLAASQFDFDSFWKLVARDNSRRVSCLIEQVVMFIAATFCYASQAAWYSEAELHSWMKKCLTQMENEFWLNLCEPYTLAYSTREIEYGQLITSKSPSKLTNVLVNTQHQLWGWWQLPSAPTLACHHPAKPRQKHFWL